MTFTHLSKVYLVPLALLALTSTPSWSAGKHAVEGDFATMQAYGSSVYWSIHPSVKYATVKVTLSPADGEPFAYESDQEPSTDALDDGSYNYELVVTPSLDPMLRAELKAARKAAGGQEATAAVKKLKGQGKMPQRSFIQTGFFRIVNGELIAADAAEE